MARAISKKLDAILEDIPADVLLIEYRQRERAKPPKTRKKITPCRWCDAELSAREHRKHHCKNRPAEHNLTDEEAATICRRYAKGLKYPKFRVSQWDLASEYSITVQAVSQIIRGETHKTKNGASGK